uniref:Sentrin-specific protease 8 n=1 Tax=Caligus rogercresseyi TaxID=217165 RepID=C1BN04_CALRO|nr:Sentrin-specific protease 8 [Caligus rogercresseyi]
MAHDPVVLSLGDSLLRSSDLSLLRQPGSWLNDSLLGFYLEYLSSRPERNDSILYLSPEVSHFLKLTGSPEEVALFLEPLQSSRKEVIFLPVNNAEDPSRPGGTHWSSLIYSKQAGGAFFHLDSLGKANEGHARRTAERIHEFLKEKRREGEGTRILNPLSSSSSSMSPPNKHPFSFTNVPVLKQSNGHDCGTHVLCHAQHSLDHFYLYGSYEGLHPLQESVVKNKRKELLSIIEELMMMHSV